MGIRIVSVLAAACLVARAGVVQGVVLEHASGRPLARAVVRLDAVPSADGRVGQPLIVRAGATGQFGFGSVAPGSYILSSTRLGFFPTAFGQRLATGRGVPIVVSPDSTFFGELRMRRHGAITGRVLDDNGVGAAGVRVVAYRARLPLRSAGSDTADDRGVYRIGGLEPGKYWIRSAGHTLEDGSAWLPTFGPRSQLTRDARVHPVTVDQDTAYADLNPVEGRVFGLSGQVTCPRLLGAVVVTLSSETSRQTVQTGCGGSAGAFRFEGLPADDYELYAVSQDGTAAAFQEVQVGGPTRADLAMTSIPNVQISVSRQAFRGHDESIGAKVVGRRLDLSETGSIVEIPTGNTSLPPGQWEIRPILPDTYYTVGVNSHWSRMRRRGRETAGDWFQIYIPPDGGSSTVHFHVSDKPAEISGSVVTAGKPVPGAPVFLWPASIEVRRALGGSPQTLTDIEGKFRFRGLPPGEYRALASFDVLEMDLETAEAAQAARVSPEPSRPAAIELTLWVAP